MTAKVTILEGTYRGSEVNELNGDFELVANWKESKKGGFITVLNNGSLDVAAKGAKVRINVTEEHFEQTGELAGTFSAPAGEQKEEAPIFVETDEQTISRITKTFKFIEKLTAAAQKNEIRALIISGPAGVGKSYGVEITLERMNMTKELVKEGSGMYDIITGGTSPIGLYKKLWENRKRGNVLVFDDCDTALFDELQLNMLKAAMDTKKKRRICWMKESNALKGAADPDGMEDIPNDFVFEGSIIFLSNLKFDKVGNRKIASHLEAIMSRVHYLDLCLDTRREQLLRVKQVVGEGMLDSRNLGKKTEEAVVNYVYDNVDYLQELSLRTVLKVADLAAIDNDWEETADFTVLSHVGRMQKLAKAAA